MAHNETYEEFVEKFKPKKTTDDCYTPPEIYDVIKGWVVNEYNLDGKKIVRPFYPGGDFENYPYTDDCVVIDNPPFSILRKIKGFYNDRGIKYFLFAPHLTLFSSSQNDKSNYLVVGATIKYHNGALVKTSFAHNFKDYKVRNSPELYELISNAVEPDKQKKIIYQYPNSLITSTRLEELNKKGMEVKLKEDNLYFVRKLDAQKEFKKTVYGAGFLTNQKLDFEIVQNAGLTFELSDREKEIIKGLENEQSKN